MDEMMQRAAAVAVDPDSVTLTACREGYYPRALEVACIKAGDLDEIWMKVRADAVAARRLRRGVLAGVCLRRGCDSVTLTGRAVEVAAACDSPEGGLDREKGYCILRFTAESASMWIDRKAAHYNLGGHE